MKKFVITVLSIFIFSGLNSSVNAVDDVQDRVALFYSKTTSVAKPAQPAKSAKPSQLRDNKILMYPNPGNGFRTGFSKPQTRFSHPSRRFSQPQTRFAHKRPEYIYTREYQKNIVNRHSPGMKRNIAKQVKPTLAVNPKRVKAVNVNTKKIIACGGITYYGIQNSCK